MSAKPLLEPPTLLPAFRKYTDESYTFLYDMTHLSFGSEFRISDIDEVAAAGDPSQRLPGFNVSAVGALAVNRHCSIAADGQREQQLSKVEAMVGNGQMLPVPNTCTSVVIVPLSIVRRGLRSSNRSTTRNTTLVIREARSASNNASRLLPTRSSLSTDVSTLPGPTRSA